MDANYYKRYEPVWGHWNIKREIGRGSFGSVYEIERQEMGVTYKAALKAISIPTSEEELKNAMNREGMTSEEATSYYKDTAQFFFNECVLMSKLKGNTNIVGYEDHQIYKQPNNIGWDILIRMELLTPLIDHINSHTVDEKFVIELALDMCDALILCEKENIIHRDIKPDNIFVSPSGSYKLGDFGVARVLENNNGASTKVGTLDYTAPEVFRGSLKYDNRVDIYSLGMVMYKLLNANRLPFVPLPPTPVSYSQKEEAKRKRMGGEKLPKPAYASAVLAKIVLKACEFDPANRYKSAKDLKNDLETYLRTIKTNGAVPNSTNAGTPNTGSSNAGQNSTNSSYTGQNSANNSYTGQNSANNSYTGQNSANNSYTGQNSMNNAYTGQNSMNNAYTGQNSMNNAYTGQNSMNNAYAGQNSMNNAYTGQNSMNNAYAGQNNMNNAYAGQNNMNNAYAGQNGMGNSYGNSYSGGGYTGNGYGNTPYEAPQKKKNVFGIIAIIAAIVIGVVIAGKIISKNAMEKKYQEACQLMEDEEYDEAIDLFISLDDYKDSEDKAKEAAAEKEVFDAYKAAKALYDSGEYFEALKQFAALGSYKDSETKKESCKANIRLGDKIIFGDIEWIVYDKIGDSGLWLTTTTLVDYRKYNNRDADVRWKDCSLRTWLNGEFYNSTFTSEEKSKLASISYKEQSYTDYVSMLDTSDISKGYFNGNSERLKLYTADGSDTVWWWLLTKGRGKNCVMIVDKSGELYETGYNIAGTDVKSGYLDGAVRPVILLDLDRY